MTAPRYSNKRIDFDLSKRDLKALPHGADLEREILGCILLFPHNLNRCYRFLKAPGMFYHADAERLWKQLLVWDNEKSPRTMDDVKKHYAALRDTDMGIYLFECFQKATHDDHLEKLCLRLNEYWIARTIHRMGFHLNQEALNPQADALDTLGIASDGLAKIYAHIASMRERTLSDGAKDLSAELVALSKSQNGMLGLPSRIYGLNEVIRGYRGGAMIVVAGGTGEGKSTFAYGEALGLVLQGIPVGIVSLEMTTKEVLLIMACNLINVSMQVVLGGGMSPDQADQLAHAIERLKSLPLHVLDTPALRMGEVKATARMWHKRHGIKLLVVDHMHLLRADGNPASVEQQFTEIANQHKELAKELDIPVMALAQLARKTTSDKGRLHEVTDLKYAGGIEQAADIVLMLYRPELHGIEQDGTGASTKGVSNIIVAKLRLLPKRNVRAHFDGLRFTDWDDYLRGGYISPQALPDPDLLPPAHSPALTSAFQRNNL